MKDQVLSIEQMQHLKELGVDVSTASMCWLKEPNGDNYNLFVHDESCYEMRCLHPVPTFTLQDILKLLHEFGVYDFDKLFKENNLLNSVYEMLCLAIDNR